MKGNYSGSSEANQELERLFGPQDQVSLGFVDRMRLKLIQIEYRKETLIFRMFFDKYYRPERFNEIVNNMDKYNNINEFRTHVIQNHYKFPLKAAQKLNIWPSNTGPSDSSSELNTTQESA